MSKRHLFGFVWLLFLLPFDGEGRQDAVPRDPASASCHVTIPNGIGILGNSEPGSYGNGRLSVGPWPSGTVVFRPGGPGFSMRDGTLAMKFPWRRGVRGQLTIDGRRLDGSAPPLRARIPRGYGDFGFQSTYLIFPTAGCWEVTGRVGEASLTFVTIVEKVGDGPTILDEFESTSR